MRSTHTYVTMELTPAAHAEIKRKMLAADYGHAINGDTIDMHGIAVEPGPALTQPVDWAATDLIVIAPDGTITGKAENIAEFRQRIAEFREFCLARGKLLG